MPRRITFDLKVLSQSDGACSFYLVWDGGKRDLFANQPLSPQLRRNYQNWKRQYIRYYEFESAQAGPRSGSLTALTTADSSAAVRNAEDNFITTFLDWLGAGDTRIIERQLQSALIDAVQAREEEDVSQAVEVRVFLACSERFLQQLPWEEWARKLIPSSLPPGAIRIIRTSQDDARGLGFSHLLDSLKKPRILAIISEDEDLDTDQDWRVLQSLRAVADVEIADWLPGDPAHVIAQKVGDAIRDDRGWDILFFAGHSDDQSNASGSFKITPTVDLSMNDVRDHIETARNFGLRLAIFNSCSGLAIARSLIQSGIQAVVMRERIRSDAALAFLDEFCQRFKGHQNVHESMLQACEALRTTERIKFPSGHLIPSFFSPPRARPYRIKPYGILQKARRWLPTQWEVIPLGIVLLLGSIRGVQNVFIEVRTVAQAVYRETTDQIPEQLPPVHLLAIDQDALDEAGIYDTDRVSQAYLAQTIQQLTELKPTTFGISFILSAVQNPGSRELSETMNALNDEQGTWFVMQVNKQIGQYLFDPRNGSDIPNILDVSFQGDSDYKQWDVDLPNDGDKEWSRCPY
ncbi:MAG: CHAT domain-containing protein, partial [Cyanobacteria bacterium J06576_12]